MIVYRRPAPLELQPCGHHAPRGTACAHRTCTTPPAPTTGPIVLRRGESIVIARIR